MKKAATATPLHLVVRIGSYQERNLGKDVVSAHNEVVERCDRVMFGKAGRILSADRLQAIRDALAEGAESKLIVVQRLRDGFVCHAAPILSLPQSSYQPNARLVPRYYHDLINDIRLWVEIGMLVPVKEAFLQSMSLTSNAHSLLATLNSCRTSLMLVQEGTNK